MNKIINKAFILQFFSYLFIGGLAAIVEWVTFWVTNEPLGLNIYISTGIAFFLATLANWILGRKITFKDAAKSKKPAGDAVAVYIVSGIALGINLSLMALFVDVLGMNPMFSKIIATGIAFLWNFISRKFIIYRKKS